LVRHTQMGSQTSSSPVSRNRQRASTTSGCNQKLRIFLQRIYIKCYPNVKDRTSHQSQSTEWNTLPSSTMSCNRFPTTSRQRYHLHSLIVVPTVVLPGQTHGLLISPCALFIFKVSTTT
jgi:hypothetical protein